ncbi:MAG: glycosyltransferase family 9 protein [Gammaproteobacteria bacterium]|nr:glycosyltransferase family 9 protein [Gammaproteobacteria bacterium]
MATPESAPSFLFINVARIGDTVFTTPAMRAVAAAYPGCRITALGHHRRVEVLNGLPFLAEVGKISKKSAPFRGWMGRRRYDYAVVYGFDEALVAYALRVAKRVVAYRQKDSALNKRLYRAVEAPPTHGDVHVVQQRLCLTDALGIPPAGLRLAYCVDLAERDWAKQRLAGDLPAGAGPIVGLQLASFPTKSYRDWPVESFAGLAERIMQSWPQAQFLIYGGNDEQSRTDWLKQRLGDRATLYAGCLTLRQTAAIMSLTDIYVGIDTGPTHIMSTFDIPLVGVFHCLSPSRLCGPLEHPCFLAVNHPRLYNCDGSASNAEITVDRVFDAVQQGLSVRLQAIGDAGVKRR